MLKNPMFHLDDELRLLRKEREQNVSFHETRALLPDEALDRLVHDATAKAIAEIDERIAELEKLLEEGK